MGVLKFEDKEWSFKKSSNNIPSSFRKIISKFYMIMYLLLSTKGCSWMNLSISSTLKRLSFSRAWERIFSKLKSVVLTREDVSLMSSLSRKLSSFKDDLYVDTRFSKGEGRYIYYLFLHFDSIMVSSAAFLVVKLRTFWWSRISKGFSKGNR